MQFGVYDTQDNCWLGNPNGPLLYNNEQDAELAAEILSGRLASPGRVVSREYDDSGDRYAGETTPEFGNDEWMKGYE